MSEIKKCQNDYPTQCDKVATVYHYDCCDGYYGIDLCVECANAYYQNGSTSFCDWANSIDGVIIASNEPDLIGSKM